jgi:hypothetical protein
MLWRILEEKLTHALVLLRTCVLYLLKRIAIFASYMRMRSCACLHSGIFVCMRSKKHGRWEMCNVRLIRILLVGDEKSSFPLGQLR